MERFCSYLANPSEISVSPTLVQLFSSFRSRGIRYCIWKSLENLREQLEAIEGDIDVLFDEAQRDEVFAALRDNSFVQDLSASGIVGNDLFVFRGFADSPRKRIMVHGHFKCRFGSKKHKEYQFAAEAQLIDSAERIQGINVLSLVDFYVTRILAATLKDKKRDPYFGEIAKGVLSLEARQFDIVSNKLQSVFGDSFKEVMERCANGDFYSLANYEGHARELVVTHPAAQQISTHGRGVKNILCRLLKIKRNKIGRVSIVLAGHDGAGKSTTTKALCENLESFGSCRRIYLGRNTWSPINKAVRKLASFPLAHFFFRRVWPLTSTLELLGRYLAGRFWLWCGAFVVYDRSLLDVKIKYRNAHAPVDRLAYWIADRILSMKPIDECRFLLIADPTVSASRTGNLNADEIEARRSEYMSAVDSSFSVVDTTQLSEHDVAHRIMQEVLRRISVIQAGKL